jgi:Ca2+-transporting ATPase
MSPQPAWHAQPIDAVARHLDTDIGRGLDEDGVARQRRMYGPNVLPKPARRAELEILLAQFRSLPVGLLGASAVISLATGGIADAVVIGAVVAINAAIGFVTERQAERTISALGGARDSNVTMLRNGMTRTVAEADVVRGDVLLLTPGTRIPADARLIHGENLSVDESMLTGESLPVRKRAHMELAPDVALADRITMVYRGTSVLGGSGAAVVVAVGPQTEIGTIQKLLGGARAPETPMQQQLEHTGTRLALLSAAICGGVFLVGLMRGQGFLAMLKSSISLAVAAVPEGLPTIATTTLALGIRNMKQRHVLIRQLDAVEALGAIKVFCFDKTGTLTRNRMTVTHAVTGLRELRVLDGAIFDGDTRLDREPWPSLAALIDTVALCNESAYRDVGGVATYTGSPTENALLELGVYAGRDPASVRARYPRVATRYRSDQHQYMVTVHDAGDGRSFEAIKGNPIEVLDHCTWHLADGDTRPLDDATRARIRSYNDRLAGQALRVLGVARNEQPGGGDRDRGWTWLGLVGMADPVRQGMAELMQRFHGAGIRTVMITGDQSATAQAVGTALNLGNGQSLETIDSTALEKMDHEVLSGLAGQVHVYSRVSPAHKLEIVRALQASGHVVAMTGDGINDGPALKAADVGVAMGGADNEVARSVAAVVLEDDNLQTMVVAVEQGRTIYRNIRKVLRFLLATNFSEIAVMFAGTAAGMAQPLHPMQLLWINLVTDIFPGLALAVEPAESDVMAQPPRPRDEAIVRRDDWLRIARESGVITLGALGAYGYGLMRHGNALHASTMTFNTLTLAQLLHAISCRSEHRVFWERGAAPVHAPLLAAVGGTMALQLAVNLAPPVRRFLNLAPMGLLDVLVTVAGAAAPLMINETAKLSQSPPLDQPTPGHTGHE